MFKKISIWGVAITTMMWCLGLNLILPNLVKAADVCPALKAGDQIKVSGKPAIYAINNELKVLYFPDGDVYKSWRPTYGGYITITQECYDSLSVPTSPPAAINYRPGTYLIKKTADATTLYAVLPGNTLAKISQDIANQLYGNTLPVMVVGEIHWPHYTNRAADISDTKVHPGMLARVNGAVYYVWDNGEIQEISDEGVTANGLQSKFIRNLPESATAGKIKRGGIIATEVSTISDRTQGGVAVVGGAPVAGGGGAPAAGGGAPAGGNPGGAVADGGAAGGGAVVDGGAAPVAPPAAGGENLPPGEVAGGQPPAGGQAAPVGRFTLTSIKDAQSVNIPVNNFLLGKFILANTGETDLNFNRIRMMENFEGSFTKDALSNVTLRIIAPGKTSTYAVQLAAENPSDAVWNIPIAIAKGTNVNIEVYGNILDTASDGNNIADKVTTKLEVQIVANNQITSRSGIVEGRNTTAIKPALPATISVEGVSMLATKLIPDKVGEYIDYGSFKFTAQNGSYRVTKMKFQANSEDGAMLLGTCNLYVDGGFVGNFTVPSVAPFQATTNLGAMSIVMPFDNPAANFNKPTTVNMQCDAGMINQFGKNLAGKNVKVALISFDAINDNVTRTYNTNISTNDFYVLKSVPTVSLVSLPSTLLSNLTKTLAKFKIAPNAGGTIAWKKITFDMTGKLGGKSIGTDDSLVHDDGIYGIVPGAAKVGVQILGQPSVADTKAIDGIKLYKIGANGSSTQVNGVTAYVNKANSTQIFFLATNEEKLQAETTYELKGNLAVAPIIGDSISTHIPYNSNSIASGYPLQGVIENNQTQCGNGILDVNGNGKADTQDYVQYEDNPQERTIEKIVSFSALLNKTVGGGVNYNAGLVWSDLSDPNHTDASFTVQTCLTDWRGEYLVKNFPLAAQIITKAK